MNRMKIATILWVALGLTPSSHAEPHPREYTNPNAKPPKQRSPDGWGDTSEALMNVQRADWEKFDKRNPEATNLWGEKVIPLWKAQTTPPFPNAWPPNDRRVVTYYAYATYEVARQHGVSLTFSAPWASIVVAQGQAPVLQRLSETIGPTIHGRHSWPSTRERMDMLIKLQEAGEAQVDTLLNWTALPEDSERSVQTIKRYYCQWQFNHPALASKYVKQHHEAFFTWLSCPSFQYDELGVFL